MEYLLRLLSRRNCESIVWCDQYSRGKSSRSKRRTVVTNEHRDIAKEDHLRGRMRGKRYPGLHGKVVDWVEHEFTEGSLYIHVRFQDRTELTYTIGSRLFIEEAVLGDISTGNYRVVREFAADKRGRSGG